MVLVSCSGGVIIVVSRLKEKQPNLYMYVLHCICHISSYIPSYVIGLTENLYTGGSTIVQKSDRATFISRMASSRRPQDT